VHNHIIFFVIRRPPSCPNPTCRYIKWVQQTYRSGGAKAQLLPLLERCTRELEALPRYRSDHRYLRLWIRYVRRVARLHQPARLPTFLLFRYRVRHRAGVFAS
jgi:Mad3/BUB1 homology region 1